MSQILDQIPALHGAIAYLIVALMVFAEDALFVGFVLPGETAAILGGVAASDHNVSVAGMCAVVVIAAILGDSVGYLIGARYGIGLATSRILRSRKDRIDAARATLARRGGPVVFGGRFVAFLRAVMPFLAGTARMPFRTFLAYNVAGATTWGIGCVLLGYLAANSYTAIEQTLGTATALIAAALVVIGIVVWRIRHRRRQVAG